MEMKSRGEVVTDLRLICNFLLQYSIKPHVRLLYCNGTKIAKMGSRGRNLSPWMGEHKQSSTSSSMAKLLDGVVFALSGFVNPERSVLRSQAMEMDAEYQTDWNPECTLLISAFSNTPKFRQVVADCGTIVSKEWIVECYQEKKLVAIEPYLMHVGKPWRRVTADQETTPLNKPQKPVKKDIKQKPSIVASSESEPAEEDLSPAKVKKWAIDDLKETIAWLESQEERPDTSDVKKIASKESLLVTRCHRIS